MDPVPLPEDTSPSREQIRLKQVSSPMPPRAIIFVFALKLYALLLLYVLFLKTDLRNGDKGFIYRPDGQPLPERVADIEKSFWERLAPYDGQWYLDIAANGYRTLSKEETKTWRLPPGNYAFFPLLPGVLWAAESVFGELYLPFTLLTMALVSALGGMVVWLLARDLGVNPYLSVAFLLAFPTAVFQFALYTEAAFILLSALTLLFATRRRPGLAAVAAILAGLTKPQGVLLVFPLFVEFLLPALKKKEMLSRLALFGRAALVLAPLSGLVTLGVASLLATDSATSFLVIQSRWGRSFALWNPLVAIGSAFTYRGPTADLIGLVFGIALLPIVWKKLPLSLAIYGTAMLLLPLSTGSLMSLGRFMGVSIPHFLTLALCLEKTRVEFQAGTVGAFATCQLFVASGLIAWHLVG